MSPHFDHEFLNQLKYQIIQSFTTTLSSNFNFTAVAGLSYWAFGYAFAFGEGTGFIGGSGFFGTFGDDNLAKWFFQMVFAATAATIVSGGVAERCEFIAYLVYSVVLTGKLFPLSLYSIVLIGNFFPFFGLNKFCSTFVHAEFLETNNTFYIYFSNLQFYTDNLRNCLSNSIIHFQIILSL